MSAVPPVDDEIRRNRRLLWIAASLGVIAVQVTVELLMGRTPICTCGYVKLFEPMVDSPGNSQHLADWYTPSHIIHGFLFYALATWLFPRKSLSPRLLLAVVIEAAWEILENSPLIIERYRSATVSLAYTGDSILNSTMDTVFMGVGFLVAAHLPVRVTIVIAIVFELFTGWLIRDNLTLNVLMLVWPIDTVKVWQSAL